MGNNNSNLTEAQFKQHWKQVDLVDGITVWENKQNPTQKLDQYFVRDENVENSQKLYQLRKENPFLVNAYTLKKEGFSCQMDNDSKKLFVQRTPLRLSNLRDIPYPDIFHLYDVCLHGYQQLSKIVGFFSVDEDQIGINEKGQAKVWLSNHFQSNKINGVSVSESKMVGDILNMLRQVTDNDTCGKYHNINWYIGNHEKITFTEAITKFVEYIRTDCEGEVPTRLSCVNEVGSNKIQSWCREQGNGYAADNTRQVEQYYQNQAGGGVVTNIAPGATYANRPSNQPVLISNSTVRNPILYNGNAPVVDTRVSQTNPAFNGVIPGAQNTSVTYQTNNFVAFPQAQQVTGNSQIVTSVVRPLKTQNLVSATPVLPNPPVSFNSINYINKGQPAPSLNLVRTNSGVQNLSQFIQRPVTINSEIKFANNANNPPSFLPSTQVIQQIPNQTTQVAQQMSPQIQKCQPPRPVTYFGPVTTVVPFQNPIQLVPQTQNVVVGTTTSSVPQGGIPSYNQPLQVVESISFNQTRDQNRLQQQRVISQTIQLKDGGKAVETQNIPTYKTQANGLKGSETIDWEDYTNKQKSNNNGLSNFGRSVPYSFDVTTDKKTQNLYSNKFTPESDGKSSPEFLALLSQIKSGVGQTNNYSSDNYTSYSPVKGEGSQGSYGTYGTFEDTKYTSVDYVSTKYTGGLDPQLHADIQKYKQ